MKPKKRGEIRYAVIAAVATLSHLALADTDTWLQTTGDPGLFNAPANWSPAGPPAAGDTAIFMTNANVLWDNTTGNTTNTGLDIESGSVQFSSSGGPFTHTVGNAILSGGTLTLSQHNLTATTSLEVDGSAHLIVASGSTLTGSGTISGGLAVSGGTVNTNGNLNISGQFTYGNASALNIASGNTFNLSGGAGSFTAAYFLSNAATMAITNGGSLSSSDAVNVGDEASGTLVVDGAGSQISNAKLALWGFAAGQATITFSNGGVGSFTGGLQIGTGVGGAVAHVSLLSGGQLSCSTLVVGGGNSTVGSVNINGGTLIATDSVNMGKGATISLIDGGLSFLGPSTSLDPDTTLSYMGGTLNMGTGQTLVVAGQINLSSGGNKRLKIGALTITGSGQIDLSDNRLIVDYGNPGPSPLATIRSYLVEGRNGGSWTGTGVTSSTAASVAADGTNFHKTALGYGEASVVLGPGGGSFAGETVDGSAVLVRYTLLGDTNLDGQVNSLDFTAMAAHFGQTGGQWTDGDYNYDGTINALDFNALATNFGVSIASPTLALDTLVPEPSALAAMLLVAGCSLRRRVARRKADIAR